MTELTKEALTDAIRSAAVKAGSTDERRLLNYAAGEIERQGNEIERLKSDMRELTEAMNRARRAAKELGEENHALRNPASTEKIIAQLEALKYTRAEPSGWTCKTLAHGRVTDDVAESWNGAIDAAILTVSDWDALRQVQQEPKLAVLDDERAAYEIFISGRLGDTIDTRRAQNGDPKNPDYMAWDMTVGWIAWQGHAAMLQDGGSEPATTVTAEHQRVIGMLLGVCGAAFELADDSCQQDVDGEARHVVPDSAFQKLSDALDEIENTLPNFYPADLPNTVLQWAAVPRHALRSLLQLSGNSEQVKTPTISFYRDGIVAAAQWVEKTREAYDSEHGRHDPDTGTFEFGNDAQQEYSETLRDIEEGIRALHPGAPGNSPVIPDGYKLALVPMEHTEAFCSACTAAFEEFNRGTGPCGVFIAGHRAMLAAAPQSEGGAA